jgi:small subunit ribosomal protein S15
MITKEQKRATVVKLGANDKDTGDAAVQIGLLTDRINGLVDHFARSPKDHSSRRGLLMMVGHRRRLLSHLRGEDPKRYTALLKELNLRK